MRAAYWTPNLFSQSSKLRKILQVVPGNADATLILGVAQRRSDRLDAARSTLEDLVATKPLWPTARYELG